MPIAPTGSLVRFGAALREFGQAFDRWGSFMQGRYGHLEKLQRTRRINGFKDHFPTITDVKFIAPSATVIGQVAISPGASIWYNAVVRGDRGKVSIGEDTHILERVVIRSGILSVRDVKIGKNVVIEAGAVISPCHIDDGAYIGANAVLMEGCKIGKGVVVSPGAVVPEFAELLQVGVYQGVPAKNPETLTADAAEAIATRRADFSRLAAEHEEMNTRLIEKQTEERVVLKDLLEKNLNEGEEFFIKSHKVLRAPNYAVGNVIVGNSS
jgi:carbonic anhydrase/acetyltransferase-like protein (isoleucine patch superfamily)